MTKLTQFLFVFVLIVCRLAEAKDIYRLAYGDGTLQALNTASGEIQILEKIDNVKGAAYYDPFAQNLYFIVKGPMISRSITVVDAGSRTVEVKFPGFDEVIIPRSKKVSFITMVSSEDYLEKDPLRRYERMEIRDRNHPRKLFAQSKTGDSKFLFSRSYCSNGATDSLIDGSRRRSTNAKGAEVFFDYSNGAIGLIDCWEDGSLLVPDFDAKWDARKGVFQLAYPLSSGKKTLGVDTKLLDNTVTCVAAGEKTKRWMCLSEGNKQSLTLAVYDADQEVGREVIRKALDIQRHRFISVGSSNNRDVLFWLNQRVSRGDTLHRGNVLLIVDLRDGSVKTSFVKLSPPKDQFGLPAELQVVFEPPVHKSR
jgi:hypothetical protein